MNRTTQYYEDFSQTAIAVLALLAAGKSLDKTIVNSLCSLLLRQNGLNENRVHLTIFSDLDDDDTNAEPPVIIPFASQQKNANSFHSGYGTLSCRNRMTPQREEHCYRLRLFSPVGASSQDEDESHSPDINVPSLRLYAE